MEDHDDTAQALARLLKLEGHTAEIASTFAQAHRFCLAGTFDIILCDLGLPDGDGTDLARLARAARPGIKMVAVTGFSMPEDLERIAAAGFDGHIIKPFTIKALTQYLA